MEDNAESSPNRPSIAFPLGLALLLILLFCICAFLFCYLKWDHLRILIFQHHVDVPPDSTLPQPASPVMKHRPKIGGQSLPVLMPGDQVPRFIAMACPCEPAVVEKITIQVQKPPPLPPPFYYS